MHSRWVCPKFLRQTFHEFAGHSIPHSEWAKAYYEHLRKDEKKDHHAAVRSLAFKWIRIIFRCWKDGKPYEEQIYLQSLRRRIAPWLPPSHQPPALSGRQSPASKNFLKIKLDGSTQNSGPGSVTVC